MLTVPDLSTNPPATTAAVYLWDGQAFDRFTAYYVDHVIKVSQTADMETICTYIVTHDPLNSILVND